MLLMSEKRFRRLNAPALLEKVYAGERFEDGIQPTQLQGVVA